jgi:DinB superfamily
MGVTLPTDTSRVTKSDLRRLTNELLDATQKLLRRCIDADVTFVPLDPHAVDTDAGSADDVNVAWTLGHIIVHMTATAEESAALAAELARSVAYHGRSRREVPWQTVKTLAQCRARLEESHRICCASLDMWPDQPDLANTYIPWEGANAMGPVGRFLLGLQHESDHLEQLRDVIGQARTHRQQQTRLGRWRSRSSSAAAKQTVA